MTTENLPAPQDKSDGVLNVGGDKVKPALAALIKDGRATQKEVDLVWWYYAYAKENGWSLSRSATELGVDSTTIYRAFNGTYGAKYSNVCGKIERFKKLIEVRGHINDVPFVDTSIANKVQQVCHAAWASQSIAMIWGESQTGKTYALEHFARTNNHGTTKYVRLPSKGGIQMVAKEIARSCYVSPESAFEGIRDRILKAIDSSNLVILDEVHEAFISYQKTSAVSILEFFREIHDRTHCGMVLCMTNIGRDEIERGKLAHVLKQVSKRGVIKLQLPDLAPEADFHAIAAKAFGLPKADGDALEILRTIRQNNGIGVFCHYLKMGARLANNLRRDFTWDHFARAYNALLALSSKSEGGPK